MRFLELHGDRAALGRAGGFEAVDRKAVRLDLPRRSGKSRRAACGLGAQGDLCHQRLGKGGEGGDKPGFVIGKGGDVLIELPQRALQGEGGVVGENFLHLADLDGGGAQVRGKEKGGGIGKGVKHRQSLTG